MRVMAFLYGLVGIYVFLSLTFLYCYAKDVADYENAIMILLIYKFISTSTLCKERTAITHG